MKGFLTLPNKQSMKTTRALPYLYLLLGLAQAAHSIEEILTGLWKNFSVVTEFINSRFPAFPVMSWSVEGFAAANLVIVALLLAFSPFPFLQRPWLWTIVRVIAIIEMLNGSNHIITAIIQRSYFSGCVSAIFLFIIGLLILIKMRKTNGYQTI